MRKKWLSVLLTAGLLTGLLAGCGEEQATETSEIPETSKDSEETADVGEKKELEIWHYWSTEQEQILKGFVDEFNEQSKTVSVKCSCFPYAEYKDKVLTSTASGDGPDILAYGNNDTAVLAESGVLAPMTDLVEKGGFKERILPEVMRSHEYNGEYYGLPIYGNCLATVYKGNIIKNLIMDCQSYTKYRPNETTGGIFVSWRRKEELPTGA